MQNPAFTALSKPSDHGNLWGDDTAERMDFDSGNNYQAPFYYNSVSTYEPGATTTNDGSLTPAYNTFCTDCHNSTNTIYSTALGRNLIKIDWDNEKHGKGNADSHIDVLAPYSSGSGSLGYVLSCLDCHEPHGSPNLYLLRREVNGGALSGTISNGYNLSSLCERCHDNSWQAIHHNNNDRAYELRQCGFCHGGYPQECMRCHYHGATTGSDGVNTASYTPTIRRTF